MKVAEFVKYSFNNTSFTVTNIASNGIKWQIEWTENSCHRDFWKIMMGALPNIIPKSVIEVLNRLENDEDNQYSWKLTWNQDSLSLTVNCKLPPKTPNKAKDDSEVA